MSSDIDQEEEAVKHLQGHNGRTQYDPFTH